MHRILVVEDNADLAFGLRNNLEIEGYVIEVAEDGTKGLVRARASEPDLIILDLMMPEMSGWEIAERLREDEKTKGIPLVFLSARTQDEDRRRGEELGVAGYVTKPFDPAELVSTIRGLTKPE